MSLRNALQNLAASLESLKSFHVAEKESWAAVSPFRELVSNPPAGLTISEDAKSALKTVETAFETDSRRFAIIASEGGVQEQFDALEVILADLESPKADSVRALLDGIYHQMAVAGVAEGQNVARSARDEVIRAETRAEVLASLPENIRKQLPLAITSAQSVGVSHIRESLVHLEKFSLPGDLRDRLEQARLGLEKLNDLGTSRPEIEQRLSVVREGIRGVYEFAASVEVMDDIRKRIVSATKVADVRRVISRLSDLEALDVGIAAPNLKLSERIRRMLAVVAKAETLAE